MKKSKRPKKSQRNSLEKESSQKKKFDAKHLVKNLAGIFLVTFAFLFGSYMFYAMGYDAGFDRCVNSVFGNYNDQVENQPLYLSDENGITLYSDVNDFTHIKKLLDDYNISINEYNITGIFYYQNKSPDGYYEHAFEMACDGSYSITGRYVILYKCLGNIILRDVNIPAKESEAFILLHELGHYKLENHDDEEGLRYTQKCADNYAIWKLTGNQNLY